MAVTNSNQDSEYTGEMSNHMLKRSSTKFISLEICTNRDINIDLLNKLNPKFCSVPWFNDSHSQITLNELDKIPALALANRLRSHGHTVLLHIAGKSLTRQNAIRFFNKMKSDGIRNILALQGDATLSGGNTERKKFDFPYASDLVKFIRDYYKDDFSIAVAGYSETHPESDSFKADLQRLKEKVDYGADFIITQAIFDYDKLKTFEEMCRKIGVMVPIIPGIFIINSFQSLKMMKDVCRVPIPEDIMEYVEENQHNVEAVKTFGIQTAKGIIKKIFQNDSFPGVHIFTTNHLDNIEKLYNELENLDQHLF